MSNILIFIFSFTTILFAKDKILWDLGIIIQSQNNRSSNNVIKPLVSNTQIAPSYKNNISDINSFDIIDIKMNPAHIMRLLYWNNQYLRLTKYIKKLQTNKESTYVLGDEQLLIYADALYRIGDYEDAINNLNLLSKDYPSDEKYFTLALYNKKAGDIQKMTNLLNNLITEYPDSDYIKLAKLQIRGL